MTTPCSLFNTPCLPGMDEPDPAAEARQVLRLAREVDRRVRDLLSPAAGPAADAFRRAAATAGCPLDVVDELSAVAGGACVTRRDAWPPVAQIEAAVRLFLRDHAPDGGCDATA